MRVRINFLRFDSIFDVVLQAKWMRNRPSTLEASRNEKPYKTLAGAAKIKVRAPKKQRQIIEKTLRAATPKKSAPKIRKKTIFGVLGARFGSPKWKFFESFYEVFRSLFRDAMRITATQAKLAGLRSLRLSPWSFKGLGLLSLSLSVSLLIAPRRPNPPSLVLQGGVPQMMLKASFLDGQRRSKFQPMGYTIV